MKSTIVLEPKNSIWKAKLAIALALIVMISVAVLPFFVIGEDQKIGCCGGAMPVTHDSWMHYNQMNAFWQSLSAGIAYPRWDENTHGYGAPTTSFYPPGVYYLTSAVYFVARDWWTAWAGFYWLTMLASAAAIFVYARQSLSRGASLVAAAVYVFAPYHLLNQYQRGAISEFTSFVWIPLCLLFAEKLVAERLVHHRSAENSEAAQSRLTSFAGLAASFGAFLWTHPPTAYQFLLVFGLCLAVLAIRAGKWRELGVIVVALVFGSMLAAAYFYPAIVEQQLVNGDDVQRVWPYHASYVFDYSQTVYDRVGNPFFVRLDRIWVFNLAAILTLSLALWKRRTADGRCSEYRLQAKEAAGLPAKAGTLNARVWLWIAAGLLASFLMTKYSAPIGRLIPKIEIGVYSWRMLTLTSFAMAMLAGGIADCGLRIADWRRVVALVVLFGVLAMSGYYVAWPMWRAQSFEPNLQHYNYATLPAGSPRENPVMPPVQLAAGKGSIVVERWTPEFRRLRVGLSENDQLQFRTRNFAGWTATIDGKLAPINEGSVKNILVNLPAGEHRVTLEFRSTPIRRVSNWITILSFAVLLSIIILKRRNS
ncbi:MAG: hypothetical protein KA368_18250 [Acidobacteria bacterium]|nr:hypothetical protein [Acidobacteriota bacterium]